MKTLILLLTLVYLSLSCQAQCGSGGFAAGPVLPNAQPPYGQAVENIVNKLNQLYGYQSSYFYYDDSANNNAYASRQDGNVYLGINFLTNAIQGPEGIPGIYCIIAHEFGHLYQYNNRQASLLGDRRGVRYGELQADFLAGYTLVQLGYISADTYQGILLHSWNAGDPTGAWRDATAHGTTTERVNDTYLGMQHGGEQLDAAYRWAYQYLPPPPDNSALRGVINLQNGLQLGILSGGVIVDSNGNQVGQMSGIPGSANFRINFSHAGTQDLIAVPLTGYVYSISNLNQPIGTCSIPITR